LRLTEIVIVQEIHQLIVNQIKDDDQDQKAYQEVDQDIIEVLENMIYADALEQDHAHVQDQKEDHLTVDVLLGIINIIVAVIYKL
jgi:hypothetical protein